jgi:hypothetical protein
MAAFTYLLGDLGRRVSVPRKNSQKIFGVLERTGKTISAAFGVIPYRSLLNVRGCTFDDLVLPQAQCGDQPFIVGLSATESRARKVLRGLGPASRSIPKNSSPSLLSRKASVA